MADVKARCKVDPATHCWIWQAAHCCGTIRMHTFDHKVGEKRSMSGPTAIWNIAHGEAPPHGAVMRMRCGNSRCANPAHVMAYPTRQAWGRAVAASGRWRELNADARRQNIQRAWEARGITPTSAEAVRLVREAPACETLASISARTGISISAASRIRRGESRREVL